MPLCYSPRIGKNLHPIHTKRCPIGYLDCMPRTLNMFGLQLFPSRLDLWLPGCWKRCLSTESWVQCRNLGLVLIIYSVAFLSVAKTQRFGEFDQTAEQQTLGDTKTPMKIRAWFSQVNSGLQWNEVCVWGGGRSGRVHHANLGKHVSFDVLKPQTCLGSCCKFGGIGGSGAE